MANLERDNTDLPDEDKDGNAITTSNPLILEDILVRIIESTDPVLGLRAGETLDDHSDSPYNWALLGLFLRDIYLNDKIDNIPTPDSVANASATVRGIIEIANTTEAQALSDQLRAITPFLAGKILEHSNAQATTIKRGTAELATQAEVDARSSSTKVITPSTLPDDVVNASATARGIAEIANQTEGRGGTDNERIMTALRVLDFLRSGTGVGADTSRRGTVERATTSEATGLSDTTRHLTAVLVKAILEHSNANATTSKRGTAELATTAEANTGTSTTKVMTPDAFNDSDAIQGIKPTVSLSSVNATLSGPTGSISVTDKEIIGKILYMRITIVSTLSSQLTRRYITISGGKWRLLSIIYYNTNDNNYETGSSTDPEESVEAVSHNSNNIVFAPKHRDTNDIISIIAILED